MDAAPFKVGDICVDRSKFTKNKALRVQKLQIRKFVNDKAIVHYTHSPAGMVLAVNLMLLNTIDDDGFLCPSPIRQPHVSYRKLAVEESGAARIE